MRTSKVPWVLPGEPVTPPAHHETEVLIEFDGPELRTMTDDAGGMHLAILSDRTVDGLRWIEAPMTPAQYAAVMRGDLALHDVFRGGEAWVIDRGHDDRALRGWRVDGCSLADAHLPKRGAFMPDDLQRIQETSHE
jgi:hypothetical protein